MSLLIEEEDGSFLPGARPRRASVRSELDTHTKTAGGVGSEADKDHRSLASPGEISRAAPCAGPAPAREARLGSVRGRGMDVFKNKSLDLFAPFRENSVTT